MCFLVQYPVDFRGTLVFRRPLEIVEPLERTDEIGAVSHLWYAELVGREVLYVDGVTKLLQHADDRGPGAAAVVLEDVGHVLQDEVQRPLDAQDVVHLEEEIALICVLKAKLVPSFREGLTREACG